MGDNHTLRGTTARESDFCDGMDLHALMDEFNEKGLDWSSLYQTEEAEVEASPLGHDQERDDPVHIPAAPRDASESKSAQPLVELQDRDQLLSLTRCHEALPLLYNTAREQCGITFAAHLVGTFYGPSARSPNDDVRLTCYRRSLFQITGMVLLPRDVSCVAPDSTTTKDVVGMFATLDATETIHGNPVKLVIVPRKQEQSNNNPGHESGPVPLPLNLSSSGHDPGSLSSSTVAWSRLQFRVSTEKRGRSKGKQTEQLFILNVRIMAKLADGSSTLIERYSSTPVIVRGRSPINFEPPKETTTILHKAPTSSSNTHSKQVEQSQQTPGLVTFLEPTVATNRANFTGKELSGRNGGDRQGHDIQDSDAFNIDSLGDSQFITFGPVGDIYETQRGDSNSCRLGDPFMGDWNPVSLLTDFELFYQGHHDSRTSPHSINQDDNSSQSPDQPRNIICSEGLSLPSIDESGSPGHYEYFPLSLEDRTPPVQAVYVSIPSIIPSF